MNNPQSFAWWSFRHADAHHSDGELLDIASTAGMSGVEMLPSQLYDAAHRHDLRLVTMAGHSLERGFNDPSEHENLRTTVRRSIDHAHEHGVESVIVFAGTRGHTPDDVAIEIVADGLGPLVAEARAADVSLLIEVLNSRVDHPGHQCDRSAFARSVIERIGAPGLRILYDVYHAQIMEGDLVHTIHGLGELIGHVHTAGVPGRHELDDNQEIHWPAIRTALTTIGYEGWVGHEFVPRGDVLSSLQHAASLFAA